MRGLILLTLLLAGIAQVLALYEAVMFGKIPGDYAIDPSNQSEAE